MHEFDRSPNQNLLPYDPDYPDHQAVAATIEPRLAELSPAEATYRRGLLQIAHAYDANGAPQDYLFVSAEALPFQSEEDQSRGQDHVDPYGLAGVTAQLRPRQYATNNGQTIANIGGELYFSCTYVVYDGCTIASGASALAMNGFEQAYAYVPFSNGPSNKAARAAVLNAAVPGLASDYMPDLPDAGAYRFVEDPYTTDGEMVRAAIPDASLA